MRATAGVLLVGRVTLIGRPIVAAQRGEERADEILDMLVWGASATAAAPAIAEPLRTELREYLQRGNSYRPVRPLPSSGETRLVNAGRIRYERLFAFETKASQAPTPARITARG
jgi:hypothetical protein